MVNNRNVSRYQGAPPIIGDSAARKIPGGPLYDITELAVLLSKGVDVLIPWTRKCAEGLQESALELEDVLEIFRLCVVKGIFLGAEWCKQNPTGPWAACDAYRVYRSEWIQYAHKEMQIEYYLKFAIGMTGVVILMASCHLSENRN